MDMRCDNCGMYGEPHGITVCDERINLCSTCHAVYMIDGALPSASIPEEVQFAGGWDVYGDS